MCKSAQVLSFNMINSAERATVLMLGPLFCAVCYAAAQRPHSLTCIKWGCFGQDSCTDLHITSLYDSQDRLAVLMPSHCTSSNGATLQRCSCRMQPLAGNPFLLIVAGVTVLILVCYFLGYIPGPGQFQATPGDIGAI
jgi:hypothetical protein